ncbi:Octanoyltransferase [Candidatus Hartigia pinicola]|nr:Octanoyltransferase [Candidatus Hartigia pinicola]
MKAFLERVIILRQLGLAPYREVSDAMHSFTETRIQDTIDELWFVEHFRVFTQGQAGKAENILAPGDIPVIQSDRGGQVTYHGPGQQVIYVMLNLKRNKISVRDLVSALEGTVIKTLAYYHIKAHVCLNAPGVYINGEKICSLGLRIRKGCSFHGLALNINMDLEPFDRINPCGYAKLKMTQMCNFIPKITLSNVQDVFIHQFCDTFGFHIF